MTRSTMTLITAAALLLAAATAQAAYNYRPPGHVVGPAPGAIGITVPPTSKRQGFRPDPSLYTDPPCNICSRGRSWQH